MLSGIENLDIMLGENHFGRNERDESVSSNQARRPESSFGDEYENNVENTQLDAREAGLGSSADYGRNSTGGASSAEINRLTSELNSRLSREPDDMMSSVNPHIQRAISDAISDQIFPQSQSVQNAELGQSTLNKWNVPSERPGMNPEVLQSANLRNNLTSKPNRPCDGSTNSQAYDMMTGDNESPIEAPESLTGRVPSRNHLHSFHDDFDPLLDTTIPAQKKTVQDPELDPINRLADVLTSMQNRPTAQQLTIRPVNSNTMTLMAKMRNLSCLRICSTKIKMQPEM